MPRKTKEQSNSEKKGGLLKSLLSLKKDKSAKKEALNAKNSSKEENVKASTKKAASKKDDVKASAKKAASKKDDAKKAASKKDDVKASTKKAASKKDDAKASAKKAASKKDDAKASAKKAASKKDDAKASAKKAASKKDDVKASAKKAASKKDDTKASTKKVTRRSAKSKIKKDEVAVNSSSEKNISSKSSDIDIQQSALSRNTSLDVFSPEYYDLPYRYNQTVIKILAQTPKSLFIYWDISDQDRKSLISKFGEHFFEITKPVLIVHNQTMNYSFEVDINDFTNSWYLNINDSNCKYSIELGRRPIPINYNYIQNYDKETDKPIIPIEAPYIYISSSNDLDAPNDKILFNQNVKKLYFKNVKTNQIIEKDISEFPFVYSNGEFVGIYEIYSNLFKDEEILNEHFNINNPSSGNPGSSSLSSRFK